MGLQTRSRRPRSSRRRAPMAEINVTPFVDVMLVLLIIFMVTAPLIASGVPIDLPDSRANPLDQDPDQVTVSIDEEGFVYIDDALVEVGTLPQALEQLGDPEQRPLVTLARRSLARLRPGDRGYGRAEPRGLQLHIAGHE